MTATPASTAPAPARPDTERAGLEAALHETVQRQLHPHLRHIAHYHLGWADAEGRPTGTRGGKLLRPTLALLSARAAGGTVADGLPAAVAIELVHNFSLLHDDIMDGDTTRRGRPTAWTVFGVPHTILAGDAMAAAATGALLDAPLPGARPAATRLTTATQRMISGQSADVAFERRDDVTLPECVRMAGDKTGALLGCACSLGAALVGAAPARVERLAAFGEHIGLAFQLVDDLLGIWGDPDRTGKQVGADLRVRKKSLPVVAALNAPGSDELRALYLRSAPLTEPEVRRVADLVERAGGRDWARAEADRRITAARECLDGAGIADAPREEFLELARFVVGRRF
ncbi:polyprenyl synthetase family protein [Streptomyces harbinensis]|uniref:polyprenyl synthetase family protein n=1 Tax=Streptomyces harbinensis TaxID=1176198 RepID=UPI003712974F